MALARRRSLLRDDVPAVVRHGRACPGHPRALAPRVRTWIPGTRAVMRVMGRCVAYGVMRIMTARMKRRSSNVVMAGLVLAIHVLRRGEQGRGGPGTSRGTAG